MIFGIDKPQTNPEQPSDLLTQLKQLIPDFDQQAIVFQNIDTDKSLQLMLKAFERLDSKSKNELSLLFFLITQLLFRYKHAEIVSVIQEIKKSVEDLEAENPPDNPTTPENSFWNNF